MLRPIDAHLVPRLAWPLIEARLLRGLESDPQHAPVRVGKGWNTCWHQHCYRHSRKSARNIKIRSGTSTNMHSEEHFEGRVLFVILVLST